MDKIKPTKSVRFNPDSDYDKELYQYAATRHGGNFSGYVRALIEADRSSGGLLYRLADSAFAAQIKGLLEGSFAFPLQAASKIEDKTIESDPIDEIDEDTLDQFC